MSADEDWRAFVRLVESFEPGSELLRVWPFTGGVSADVTGVEFRTRRGEVAKLVVRRHKPHVYASAPQLAVNEFALLQRLHAAGIPVPAPRSYADGDAPFSTPAIVLEYIDGTTSFEPDRVHLAKFAQQLAHIHALDLATLDAPFLPQRTECTRAQVTAREGADADATRILDALAGVRPAAQRNSPVLLHGDYWPGNTLWRDDSLVAIIDWEDAVIGDPLIDLANSRLELFWLGGEAAMEAFTQHYLALSPLDLRNLAYWELCASLLPALKIGTWGLEAATEQAMRAGLGWFVEQAIGRLYSA